jgi:hypothetical protein
MRVIHASCEKSCPLFYDYKPPDYLSSSDAD